MLWRSRTSTVQGTREDNEEERKLTLTLNVGVR
ncbi:hypothetical protein J2W92_005619 [Rhizobium leguminosarum]